MSLYILCLTASVSSVYRAAALSPRYERDRSGRRATTVGSREVINKYLDVSGLPRMAPNRRDGDEWRRCAPRLERGSLLAGLHTNQLNYMPLNRRDSKDIAYRSTEVPSGYKVSVFT